jgi:sulfatase maturation enzyme AslB (radical SAM superfamily)
LVSGGIETADHKTGDFIVEYLGELEFIFKKGLARGSGTQTELFDEKKTRCDLKKVCTGICTLNCTYISLHNWDAFYKILCAKTTSTTHHSIVDYFFLS